MDCSVLIRAARIIAQGQAEEVLADLESYLQQTPTDADAQALLASAYEIAGRPEDARIAWSAVQRSGKVVTMQNERAPMLVLTDTFRESINAILATDSLEEIDDLHRLIAELQTARIMPLGESDDMQAPVLEDDLEGMVSETLARIYASQEQYAEAADTYDQLAALHPGKAGEYLHKARDMRERINDEDA